MNLTRYEPRMLTPLHSMVDRWFNNFPAMPWEPMRAGEWFPAADVYETEKEIVIKADVPDMEQKDLDVKIEENVLTLSGKRESETEVTEDDFYRHERSFGTFTRRFTLPETADHEHIGASYEKGVLTVKIPKKEVKPKDVKKIKVH